MTPKISSAVRSILAGVSSLAAASVAVADPQLTNLSECPTTSETQSCGCSDDSGNSVADGCIKINLAMGLTTPWTGSRTAAIKVFSDDFAPSVFTPETLHAVVGYTYKRLGQKVLADGRTPKEVVFSHPNGEPVYFVFKDGETTAAPDRGRHIRMDVRLMMVDSQGWATTKDPVYYDLHETDGTVRRFLATDRTGERGRLLSVTDSNGITITPEDMGIDIVRNADGLRQFLTPSRLADVRMYADGYDVRVYALQAVPARNPQTGLYAIPNTAPVTVLTFRRGADDRHVDVTLKTGSADPVPYFYEFADGDWSLTHPTGLKEIKTKQICEGTGARITKTSVAGGTRLSYYCKDYQSFSWGFSMTNKLEGCNGVSRETQWTYVQSGNGKGLVATERLPSGLLTEFSYDARDRVTCEVRTGTGMAAERIERSYASLDPADSVPPADSRPCTVVKRIGGVEVSRTYYVYAPFTNIVERAAVQGAAFGATGSRRTVTTFWPAGAGVLAGKVKSVRREDGRFEAYDYSLADGVWTETVTRLHEQAMSPVSGRTTRDITVTNRRGETTERRTEAYIGGNWYTIARTMQEYNAQGKVIRSTDLAGRVTATAWDCCHKLSETRPDGQVTTWDYDVEGRLTSTSRLIPTDLTNVTWVTTCYAYDGLGRQTATWTTNHTARIGIPATTTTYDGLGRVTSRSVPGRGTSLTTYSSNGLIVTNTAPNGALTITRRNADGDTISVTGDGVTPEFYSRGVLADGTRWTKTVQGESASSPRFTKSCENLLGETVRIERSGFRGAVLSSVYTYDNYGRLVSSFSDGEPTTEQTYDTLGERIATTTSVWADVPGGPTEWRKSESSSAYELRGDDVWLAQTTSVSCSDAAIPAVTQARSNRITGLSTNLLAQAVSMDARGNTSESWTEYDGFTVSSVSIAPEQTGRATSYSRLGVAVCSVSASSVDTRSLYDGLGRQVATIDGRGKVTRTEYDGHGRRVASLDADGNRTAYAYDEFGELVAVTNAMGEVVTYSYDLRGHKTYEGGATYPVRYAYDLFGNKVSMTTYRDESLAQTSDDGRARSPSAPSGDTTTWLYDEASGAVTNKVYADGKGPSYDYDTHGRLTKRTWARGIDTTYTYDAWGSLTRTDYSDDTPSIVLSYDAMGRQTRAVDAAGVTTFAYDSFGSLTNETVVGVAGTNTIERFYDAFGRDAGYALNGVRQSTLGYEPATGRLTTMLAAGNETPFTWNYLDGSDLKSSLAYPNGLTVNWSYSNRGELLKVNNASPTGTISKYAYTYDAAGCRVACAKSGTAFEQADSVNYGYNTRSELTNATAAVDSAYRYGYDFDDIGNRRSSLECGVQSAEYEANRLNQYAAVDDFTPQYDEDGNQTLVKTATGTWQVTYNGENRPVRWENGDTVITMSYDRMGRRVTKNDQRFVYDGYLQIADNAGNTYVWDCTENVATRPLVWNKDGDALYYVFDGNKNVSEVIDSGNDVAAHYEYAPFGAQTVSCGASAAANPWRFSSEYVEDDTATVYYNYRHYEPVTGRWMGRDPIEEDGGLSLYLYCNNASISLFDCLGLDYLDCLAQCIERNDPINSLVDSFVAKLLARTALGYAGVPKSSLIFMAEIAEKGMHNKEYAEALRQYADNLRKSMNGGKTPLAWKPVKSIIGSIAKWLKLPINRGELAKVARGHGYIVAVHGTVLALVEANCAFHCIGKCSYDPNNGILLDVRNAIDYYLELFFNKE